MNHVGASVARIHSVYTRAPIHTDGARAHMCAHARERPRNDERNTRPSSLVHVKYCLLLVLIVSTSFIPVQRERGDKCRNLPLSFSPSSLSLSEHIHARVFVGGRHKSVPQLYQRPQKEIISDRFYRDGFSASHASGIKAAMQVSLYDPLSSSILMPLVVAVSN